MHNSGEVKQSPQYEALQKYLADGFNATDDALDAFCEEVETGYRDTQKSEDLEEPLLQAWRAVVTMAASQPHISESRQKLVDFVLAVQKRPALVRNGEACIVQDARVWQDLPVFGMEMREAWNLAAERDSSAELRDMWINLNAWTATLVATVNARGQASPDFSLYCIWTVRMALEEEDPSDVALEAAAVWFVYASSSIYQMCLASKTFDGKVAKPGSLCKDREWRGFSQNRWASWVRQTQKFEQSVSGGVVPDVVAEASRAMRAVDGTSCARM